MAAEQRRDTRIGGIVAGKYRIGRLLDRGGMASAYLAVNEDLDLQVIVKLLQPEWQGNDERTRKFRHTASVAVKLQHPNIAAVLDAGLDGELYMVLERPRGVRLRRFVATLRPVPLERIVSIMEQLLGAIAEVHRHGLIHGDVRSDNVLIETNHDGADVVKLIDFGPVRHTETLRGPQPGTVEADLYNAGTVLNEMLRGHNQPTPLDAVVRQALAEKSEERFQTVGQMVAAMQKVLRPPKRSPSREQQDDPHSDLDEWLGSTLKDVRRRP